MLARQRYIDLCRQYVCYSVYYSIFSLAPVDDIVIANDVIFDDSTFSHVSSSDYDIVHTLATVMLIAV